MYDESIKYARMCGYFKGRLMVLSMACIPGITIHSRKAFDDYIMDIVNNAESECKTALEVDEMLGDYTDYALAIEMNL